MFNLVQLLAFVCIFLGILFSLVASIGLFRFPDVFTRIHAAGITDTLGVILIFIGLMLMSGWNAAFGKLLLILLFTLLTSPTISYVLANTAIKHLPLAKSMQDTEAKNSKGAESSNR